MSSSSIDTNIYVVLMSWQDVLVWISLSSHLAHRLGIRKGLVWVKLVFDLLQAGIICLQYCFGQCGWQKRAGRDNKREMDVSRFWGESDVTTAYSTMSLQRRDVSVFMFNVCCTNGYGCKQAVKGNRPDDPRAEIVRSNS
jgi:hypothetical protein